MNNLFILPASGYRPSTAVIGPAALARTPARRRACRPLPGAFKAPAAGGNSPARPCTCFMPAYLKPS